MEDIETFFSTAFPGMGGLDGGWCQGFGYGDVTRPSSFQITVLLPSKNSSSTKISRMWL